MDRQYWNEELETAPWPDVEAWQAGRLEQFLDSLRTRSAFHKDRLGSATRRPTSSTQGSSGAAIRMRAQGA